MTNHLWHGHLPWTINSCTALLGCCPLSKPLCQCTAGVNNSRRSPPLHCCIHLISFHQYFLGPWDSDIFFFFLGWGMRANRRQAGVIGVTVGGCWGTPAAVFLKLLPLYLCHSMPPLPPSLTVPCPSASCRFLIKENISLIPPLSYSLPLLLHLLLSSLSYRLPSRVRRPGSLPSACLWNLWAEPRYVPGMLKLNAFPFFFISFLSLSPLGFENSCLEHCFPTKQVASHGSHVGRAWIECLAHCLNEKKETSFIFSLLLSAALLFFSKSSTKIPSRLLPVFAIKSRTIHLVNPSLCPCFPMISKMQLTSAPLWHLTKSLKSKAVWICMMVKTALKQEALPSCRDPQSSSNHQWCLWCSIQLMAYCYCSLFTSTWAGWHSQTFLLCYQNKCMTLVRGLDLRLGGELRDHVWESSKVKSDVLFFLTRWGRV